MKGARATQCEPVLELLRDGCWHTTIEFVELGILRLPSRVHELRRRGFVIDVRRVDRRGRSASYVYRLVASERRVNEEATAGALLDREPFPVEPVDDVELPSAEERRQIAAAARAAFARAMRGDGS